MHCAPASNARSVVARSGGGYAQAVKQLFRVSTAIAIVAAVLALISGSILFFVIEPPFLASIFLACSLIAIICFALAAIAAYLIE